MKTCPTCNAVCFDDMATCYGCLHAFTSDDVAVPEELSNAGQDENAAEGKALRAEAESNSDLPAPISMTVPAITVVPEREQVASRQGGSEAARIEQPSGCLVLRVEVPSAAGSLTIRYDDLQKCG